MSAPLLPGRQSGIADGWVLLIVLVILVGAVAGVLKLLADVEDRGYRRGKAELQLKLDKFISDTQLAGTKADAQARAREARDNQAKQKVDAENLTLKRDLADSRQRLREYRARSGGSVLPKAGPGAGGAETISFDRAELDRALQGFLDEVEGLVGEGAEAVIDLDGARKWARELTP